MSRRGAYLLAILALAVGALAFRLPALGNRPFHGDEAVHAFKFLELWKHGVYRYDPNEFHGPTLYYAALPAIWLRGRHTFAACTEGDFRLPIVLFGAAMVLVIAPLSSGLGRRAVVYAGILTAISPALVFYSRYFIQETLLAFFTLALLACGWQFYQNGRRRWLIGAGISAGLMIASKETAVLTFLAMGGALGLASLWSRRLPGDAGRQREWWQPASLALPAIVALIIACLFLSGFGTNTTGKLGLLTGPVDYLRAYTPWLHRAGGASEHIYPWSYYLRILLWTRRDRGPVYSEALIVGLALAGAIRALIPRTRSGTIPDRDGPPAQASLAAPGGRDLARFLAFYTILLTLFYSIIPYKTPWCLLSFLNGMILLAGVGAAAILDALRARPAKVVATAVLVAGCVQLGTQSVRASYQAFTDPANPYVYAQPVPDVENLEHWTHDLAHYSGQGPDMLVKVIWVDDYHWPLAWYLREFNNIRQLEGFYHDTSDPSAALVLASPEFEDELTKKLGNSHVMARFFGIRPGVLAQAWVRMDVWEKYLKSRPRPKDED